MMRLGVNIDHVATLRQARLEPYPDPVHAAFLASLGGADNITCHLREDRRHVQERDVRLIKDTVDLPLNFEMAVTDEMIKFANEIKPQAITLVPEKREELTTEGGLDIKAMFDRLKEAIGKLEKSQAKISLFVEADKPTLDLCKELGVPAVELHTGSLCRELDALFDDKAKSKVVSEFNDAANYAAKIGLAVHLGHGINYKNAPWMQRIEVAEEANIGHAIVGQALYVGMTEAVKEMKRLINDPLVKPENE